MEESPDLEIPLNNFAFLEDYAHRLREQMDRQEAEEQESLQAALNIMEKLKDFAGIKKIPAPATFRGKMRNYQAAGYRWLYFLYEHNLNGILADDMGLGKTIQAIALLAKLFEEDEIARVLIVAPVTTLANWENEFSRFAPDLGVYKHVGSTRAQTVKDLEKQMVTMVSYQTAMRDSSLLAEIHYDYLIMDESQNIKNYRSRTYRAVKGLRATHKLALTGTPIENTTMELWAQMNLLNPGLLGTERQFKKNFLSPVDRGQNPEAQKRLRRMIHPFLLRRRKEDVLKSLPPKEEIVYYCDMGERQAAIYRRYADYFQARLQGLMESKISLGNAAMEVLNGLMRMRQASLFVGLLDDKHKNVPSAKFDALKDLVHDIIYEKHKVLIFSQFVEVLTIIRNYFDEQGWDYAYLDGQTPTKSRQKAIDRFQTEDDLRIFLISLKAGGVGINLTAADYVIIFDPWWNPAVESQAVDRSHRIGQTNQVFTYRLITRDTVEEKILELQDRKRKLANDIITGEKSIFKKLSKDEILDLFS
jgi:non-specific serine/threonine protein kinase